MRRMSGDGCVQLMVAIMAASRENSAALSAKAPCVQAAAHPFDTSEGPEYGMPHGGASPVPRHPHEGGQHSDRLHARAGAVLHLGGPQAGTAQRLPDRAGARGRDPEGDAALSTAESVTQTS